MSADKEAFEPVRLRHDPTEASELREALVRETAFSADYDESKGLARFQAAIGAAGSSVEPSKSSASAARSWTAAAAGLVGLAVLSAGVSVGPRWFGAEDAAAPPDPVPAATTTALARDMPEQAAAPSVPVVAVDSLPAVESSPPAAAPPAPVARTAHSHASASPAARPPASSTTTVYDPLEETRHLSALRQESDPHRALSMADEGNRRFAGGSFREEREAIAIDALARLGRDAEAKRAAETFLVTYPTSPLASKVRRAAGL